MKKLKVMLTIAIMMVSSATFAQKYCYVDTEYILDNITEYKAAQQQLDQLSVNWQKEIEAKYHGKNIEFVSISADVEKDHEKWKKFVTEKQLGGIQLYADKNWESDFLKAFGITSIPRFILIDPNGVVVDADAARPSSPKLKEQLDGLLK